MSKININKKINYRYWIILQAQLGKHCISHINFLKKQCILAIGPTARNLLRQGRKSYYEVGYRLELELIDRKKYGHNIYGEQIGFGKGVFVK